MSTASLSEALSQSEMSLLVSILQKPEVLSRGESALRDYINKMREQANRKNQIDLKQVLAQCRQNEQDKRDKYGRRN